MPTASGSGTLGQIQRLLEEGTFTGVSDARLLERFVTRRDEAAFTALVERHGAMVRNTCRAVLKDPNAADDAFQATFVLLFRKGGSIQGGEALGGWLHRVAYRVALQAGAAAARRRDVESAAGGLRGAERPAADDLGGLLHEEIERLPERLRLPLVLCDLEGMTRDQAAERLGWTEGALRGRLAKGRQLLRNRLTRRGITLAVPLAPPMAVPQTLVTTTVQAVAGGASGAASALVRAVSRGWILTRLKVAGAAVLVLGTTLATVIYELDQTDPARPIAKQEAPARQVPTAPVVPTHEPTDRVEGRILDLEGRPVAGATAKVKWVYTPPDGKLDAWIDTIKRFSKKPYGLNTTNSRERFSATTGRDGRFRIDGMPRDCIAVASIAGPGIETTEAYILTRDVPTIRTKDPRSGDRQAIIYYGARFDHAAAPARPIVGTIRDKDTGAPIPGVHITGMPILSGSLIPTHDVEATSDAQGRYRIQGLSLSRGIRLFTEAPIGQPYVNGTFDSPAIEPKPSPFTFDMTLKRGILVRGRLTDKATGRPLAGKVIYNAFQDNAYLGEFPNFRQNTQENRVPISGSDGRFTIAALPGRGLIAARAKEERYLHGLGTDSIKGFNRSHGAFITYPSYLMPSNQHVIAEINSAPGKDVVDLNLEADPGRTVTGTIVDSDGQPLLFGNGVEVRTLDLLQMPQQTPGDPTFVVTGLPSGRYRLDFIHRGRKLAGSLALRGNETGPLTAKLQPWGTVIGRVVDEEGKPRTDLEIFSETRERPDPEAGDLVEKPTVDGQGRFRLEGLVPGVKYDALGDAPNKATGPILKGVQVGPGEVKDLGDVVLPTWKKDQS
ncbi:RNA polymerase sigma factor, sigma-70 family [Singulisphaera sp. GP187]|uniref:sigma-70 family RNA polymerase sigma factor n=1 Tax=Singulisphaera sp. GP187 TaxID=1882752 RepID=UPI0009271A14|nr:sigma-70 family RNA polymerase sigma factor [Singulisphaera sp. GP187]SIO36728.1 RNA polymerase sigma factor, sigma-70 family [Singulisphaera sp. GP187]